MTKLRYSPRPSDTVLNLLTKFNKVKTVGEGYSVACEIQSYINSEVTAVLDEMKTKAILPGIIDAVAISEINSIKARYK